MEALPAYMERHCYHIIIEIRIIYYTMTVCYTYHDVCISKTQMCKVSVRD
jgi:hypothetical protein